MPKHENAAAATETSFSIQMKQIDINLDERRLASADRNNKATLLLTALPHTIKSSAKDLSQRKVKLQYVGVDYRSFHQQTRCQPDTVRGQRPILIQLQCAAKHHRFLAWILTQRRSAIIQQMVASPQCLVRQRQKPII